MALKHFAHKKRTYNRRVGVVVRQQPQALILHNLRVMAINYADSIIRRLSLVCDKSAYFFPFKCSQVDLHNYCRWGWERVD
jgi:hypothetical protein